MNLFDTSDFPDMAPADDHGDGSFIKFIDLVDLLFLKSDFQDIPCLIFVFFHKLVLSVMQVQLYFFSFYYRLILYAAEFPFCIAFRDGGEGKLSISVIKYSKVLSHLWYRNNIHEAAREFEVLPFHTVYEDVSIRNDFSRFFIGVAQPKIITDKES